MALDENFLWGGATAANQVEGGVLEGGRQLSDLQESQIPEFSIESAILSILPNYTNYN